MLTLERSGLALALLVSSVFGGACADPESRVIDRTAPVGAEEYERILAEGSGATVDVATVVHLAQEAYREIKARMGRLARDLGAESWQQAFAELQREYPDSVEELLEVYRRELAQAAEFVAARELVTLPPEPPEVVEVRNIAIRQSFPLALYIDRRLGVTTTASHYPDPGYLANHCLACITPLAVHEGYPGHHVGLWHQEQPGEYPNAEMRERADENALNMFVLEGWGLYAELLMLEHGYYGSAEAELGAWRAILHRALRARIDPLLHTGEIGESAAVELYQRELMMTHDAAETEVRRHLAQPGNKAAYLVGVLQILELRFQVLKETRAQGHQMPLREFHDRLLEWSLPYPEVARERFGVELGALGAAEVPWPWIEGSARNGG